MALGATTRVEKPAGSAAPGWLTWTRAAVPWALAAAAQRESAAWPRSSSTTTLRGSPMERRSTMTFPVIESPRPPRAQRS